ncbi:hypothetical protein YC2023_112328 [Brassica napus]
MSFSSNIFFPTHYPAIQHYAFWKTCPLHVQNMLLHSASRSNSPFQISTYSFKRRKGTETDIEEKKRLDVIKTMYVHSVSLTVNVYVLYPYCLIIWG